MIRIGNCLQFDCNHVKLRVLLYCLARLASCFACASAYSVVVVLYLCCIAFGKFVYGSKCTLKSPCDLHTPWSKSRHPRHLKEWLVCPGLFHYPLGKGHSILKPQDPAMQVFILRGAVECRGFLRLRPDHCGASPLHVRTPDLAPHCCT